MSNPNFGEKIKSIRKTKKLTQKQLAEKINKAESTVRMWELGKNKPLPEALKVLSEVLEVNYSELMHFAGYLDKKTNLEELTSDYIRDIRSIYELSVLIADNQAHIKKLTSLIEKEQIEDYENEFLRSQIKTHEKQITIFHESLLDSVASKKRTESEIKNEQKRLTEEIEDLIGTLHL